jgi:flagellin-like hook-associated protein FlgL
MLSFFPGEQFNKRGIMSINIRANTGPTMRSLSEQGAFRNSMYQQGEEKKENKPTPAPLAIIKDDLSDQVVKNEKFRVQSAGLQSEISHVEEDMSIVQTVARALTHVEDYLLQMNELLVLVSNETEFNCAVRLSDQTELEQLINQINKVADETSYGHQALLDGSHGVRGVTTGNYLEFIGMNTDSKTSPLSGYQVLVTEVSTKSELQGERPFTQAMIDNEESLIFEEGGIANRFVTQKGVSVSNTFKNLSRWVAERGIPLEIILNSNQLLQFRHLQYGSSHSFGASSYTPGLISTESQRITYAKPGLDVKGFINAIPSFGQGQYLSAPADADGIGELTVRYTGNEVPADNIAGTVSVSQNGFQFQLGNPVSHIEQLSLESINAADLGRETENVSGFQSLQEIDIRTGQRVKDSMCILAKSFAEITAVKDRVEKVCDKTLKINLLYLQQEHNKLNIFRPNLENSGSAQVFAEITKKIITENAGRSSMAQAHQNPKMVLKLLK